ncbi:MAG: flavodoxin family protein [Opitutaceae bacterium]|nr:flavodoxin family protein [Opitutaceae bacterium]
MKTVAIVYFSGTGHTRLMAEAVQRGAAAIHATEATLHALDGRAIREGRFADAALFAALERADAIVFGTPTYMGGPAAQFKAFADASAGIWFRQGWRNKLAAGFTHSGSPSGDKLATLQALALLASQHGMLWVGSADFPSHFRGEPHELNRLGSFLGVMGHATAAPATPAALHPGDQLTAEGLGRRIAELAHLLAPEPAGVA